MVQDGTMANCRYGEDAAGIERGGLHVSLWRIRPTTQNVAVKDNSMRDECGFEARRNDAIQN